MGKTFMCKHCKKPMTTTPKLIAVGNAFHPECFNELYELQREKDRTRETELLDRASGLTANIHLLGSMQNTLNVISAESRHAVACMMASKR